LTGAVVAAYGYRYAERVKKKIGLMNDFTKIKMLTTDPQPRPLVAISLGCHHEGVCLPTPDRRDPLNALAGVVKRLACAIPNPNPDVPGRMRVLARKVFRTLFRPLQHSDIPSFDDWMATRPYPESRADQIRKAQFKRPEITADSQTHIKEEFYVDYKPERFIRAVDDWLLARCGPIESAIEKQFFSLPAFIKSVPGSARAEWIKTQCYSTCAAMSENDYTSMEVHLQGVRAAWVHEFTFQFVQIIDTDGEFLMLFDESTGLSGVRSMTRLPGIVNVENAYGLFSGKPETSYVNAVQNLLNYFYIQEYVYHNKFEDTLAYITSWQHITSNKLSDTHASDTGLTPTGMIEGDDSLHGAEIGQAPDAAQFQMIGYNCSPRISAGLNGRDFIGMVFDEDERIIVTDIVASVCSVGWASAAYANDNTNTHLALLRARGYSMLYQYTHCPVLHEMALYVLRVTRSIDVTRLLKRDRRLSLWEREQLQEAVFAMRHHEKMERRECPRTRHLVEEVYGLDIGLQRRIESELTQLQVLRPLRLFPTYLIPDSWLDFYQNYCVNTSRERMKISPIPDYPTEDPFVPGFWAQHGRQLQGPGGPLQLKDFRM